MSAILKPYTFEGSAAERLDKVLLSILSAQEVYKELSRSQLQNWIAEGRVKVDGTDRLKPGWLVQPGSIVEVTPPVPEVTNLIPSGRPIDILYQDAELLVVNKPAGLSMHPGAGRSEDTMMHAVLGYLSEEERASGARPGIVHRLDMDTTGVVVVAKTVQSHFALSRQFAGRTTGREYLALVFSTPRSKRTISQADEGVVETQIGRHPLRRKEMAVVQKGGKKAITHWRAVERMAYGTLLALKLETGRTHQIRVHMAHLGSPVIGDAVYGDFSGMPPLLKSLANRFGRQALHARTLEFDHPKTGIRMKFESPVPADFNQLIEQYRTTVR